MVDLANQEIFTAIKAEVEDALLSDDVRGAFVFVRNLPILLAEEENRDLTNKPDLLKSYVSLGDQLGFVALPSLKESEVVELFKGKLLIGLSADNIELVEKVNAHLLTIPTFTARDALRKQLREVLMANEEQLGSETITAAGAKTTPTVSNWLKKYDGTLGAGLVDQVERNQFLVSDSEVQRLDESGKKLLRRLIDLHEYLKLSSNTPEGLEDPVLFNINGKRKVLRGGEFEDVVIPSQIQAIIDETFKLFEKASTPSAGGDTVVGTAPTVTVAPTQPARQLAYDKAWAATRTMLAQSQGDARKIFDMLFDSLSRNAAEESVAALLLLAQLRKLDDILAEDERFRNLVSADLKASGQDDKVDGFRINPTAPNFIARLLKIILEDKLGLAAADALAFGERLGKMLAVESDKYSRIVVRGEGGGLRWNL